MVDITVKVRPNTHEYERLRKAFLAGTATYVNTHDRRYKGRIASFKPGLMDDFATVEIRAAQLFNDGNIRERMALQTQSHVDLHLEGTATGRFNRCKGEDEPMTLEKVLEAAQRLDGIGGTMGIIDEACIPKGVIISKSRRAGMSELQRNLLFASRYGAGPLTQRRIIDDYLNRNINLNKGTAAMQEWKFKSAHPRDIDFNEIASALSRKNPIALVNGQVLKTVEKTRQKLNIHGEPVYIGEVVEKTVPDPQGVGQTKVVRRRVKTPVQETYRATETAGNEAYVVVHKSLYEKSLVVGIPIPDNQSLYTDFSAQLPDGSHAFQIGIEDFKRWTDWAREVKGAGWEDEDRRRATFTVTLPKV
jgi:hypothetical protein